MAVAQDVARHVTIVTLYRASLALPRRWHGLGVGLGCGSVCCALVEGQPESAASLHKQLVSASLATIVAGGLFDANSEGLQFEVSGKDVGQSKNLSANFGPQFVE